jgi:methyl-accepting chemotaxis protein
MQSAPGGSVVRVVNQDGIVVAQSDNGPYWIGRDLSGSEDVAQALAAKESSGLAIWPDQVKRISASSTAHRVPWLVSVGFPTEFGSRAVINHLKWGGAFTGISLLAGFAIAWMLSGRIVGPLRQLERDALAIAGGDLSHRSVVKSGDEVGNLADAFNCMASPSSAGSSKSKNLKTPSLR